MRILALSDTHGHHAKVSRLPQADVLLHAGDFTRYGNGSAEFALWFHRLPYKLKLLTLGNHERKDSVVHHSLEHWRSLFGPMLLLDRGARATVGEEELVVFGVPYGTQATEIPEGADVVLSHDPPHGLLDRTNDGSHAGSEEVAALVERARPPAHVFGHVHAQGGESITQNGTTYVNAATRAVLFELHAGRVNVLERV